MYSATIACDFVPTKEAHYWITVPYILLGLCIATMSIDLIGSRYISKIHNFGRRFASRLKTFGELMAYQRMLRRRYGMTDDELSSMPIPYRPRDIDLIYYIDQRTDTSMVCD